MVDQDLVAINAREQEARVLMAGLLAECDRLYPLAAAADAWAQNEGDYIGDMWWYDPVTERHCNFGDGPDPLRNEATKAARAWLEAGVSQEEGRG